MIASGYLSALLLAGSSASAAGGGGAESVSYFGMCDASAGAALNEHWFAVANNDDNQLRIYDALRPGMPVATVDLRRFLGATRKTEEADLEGAARIGDRVYWIGSHSRNKEGKSQPNRRCFFATDLLSEGNQLSLRPAGRPYSQLLNDLVADPRFAAFEFRAAATLPPDRKGALNIEGLSATPEGGLLIGFRNPIPGGRALLIPLVNPAAVLEGQRARLGDPLQVDLGGLGIRDIALAGGVYWIIAGAHDGGGPVKFYRWTGGTNAPVAVSHPHLKQSNAEAIVAFPGRERGPFHILSDDGAQRIDGRECKDLKDPLQRRFRAFWVQPGP